MDEMTFQHELRELKQRVTDIANSSQPLPSAAQLSGFMMDTAMHNDLFVTQLRDVKMRIDDMQAGMPQQWQRTQGQAVQPPVGDCCPKELADTASQHFTEARPTMTVLTSDLEAMNKRIDLLEQTVHDLGNAVRESTFTPDVSETTVEDLETTKEAHLAYAVDAPGSETTLEDVLEHQPHHSTPTTLSQALHVLQQDSAIHSIQFTGQGDELDAGPTPSEILAKTKPAIAPEPSWEYPQDDIRRADVPVSTTGAGLYDKLVKIKSDARHSAASERKEITELEETIKQMHANHETAMAHKNVAIQEREQRLQNLERAIHKRDSTITQLGKERDQAELDYATMEQSSYEARVTSGGTIRQLRDELKECEASRHHFMTKYVDENYRFKWLEQRKLQSEQNLQQQLSECQNALKYNERRREAQMNHALRSRDEELDKLNAFCRDNEAIAYQQEEIIARGGLILEQRDAEIDRLHQELEDSQKEKRHLRDHGSKLKRILKNRDEEIKDLKCDVKDEKERRGRLEELMRRDADAMKPKSKDMRFIADETKITEPFVQAAEAVTRGRGRPLKSSWSPQPIRESRMLPHEENRRQLWENGDVALSKPRFGSASPIAERRNVPNKRDVTSGLHAYDRNETPPTPKPNNRHNRKQDGQGLDVNQQAHADRIDTHHISGRSSDVNSKGMEAQARANDGLAKNHRHALPLDVTRWPPLPARAAGVEKVGSVPNLRAGVQSVDRHGAISKPASMLDLRPGKGSQTYRAPSVETEAESAGEERTGSSLLD